MKNLHAAIEKIKSLEPSQLSQKLLNPINASVESLQIATERMGYTGILTCLDEIQKTINLPLKDINEVELAKLGSLEAALSEAIAQIQQSPQKSTFALPELFLNWYIDRVQSEMEQIKTLSQKIAVSNQGLTTAEAKQQLLLIQELIHLLGNIYHCCVFYHFGTAAHLTLALEDLCFRILQNLIPINDSFLNLLNTYRHQLLDILLTFRTTRLLPDAFALEAIENLTQQVINQSLNNPIEQITSTIIETLNIPAKFKESLTRENLTEISYALQAGQNIYSILANLEEDEKLGLAFMEWMQSGSITPIINISAFENQKSLFNFLITSQLDEASIQNSLKQIDPQIKYLKLTDHSITLKKEALSPVERRSDHSQWQINQSLTGEKGISPETTAELNEMVGRLVADQATNKRILTRLAEIDMVDTTIRTLKSTFTGFRIDNDTLNGFRQSLENDWGQSATDIHTLLQTEVNIDAALNQLQEKTRSLGSIPAAALLEPLPMVAQTLALQTGKQVVLNTQGENIELDQSTINKLTPIVERLVHYAITESLETPEKRQKMNKPVNGHINVNVSRTESYAQIIIEDNGNGIMADSESIGDETTELSTMKREIELQNGRLKVVNTPGRGLKQSLIFPLEFVVLDGMVVLIGNVQYIIPVFAIERIIKPSETDLVGSSADGIGSLLNIENKTIPIYNLKNPADIKAGTKNIPNLLVIIEKEVQSIALEVDDLIGRQSVVVRPLSGHLTSARHALGCALLGEGEVGMVLNLESL
jgi:two-component system, chemotaxis family, sensor kinase CheA